MAYLAGTRSNTTPLGTRLSEIFTGFSEAYAAWRVYRVTLGELQALSARDLADLGLNPGNIQSAAYEAAYGKAR